MINLRDVNIANQFVKFVNIKINLMCVNIEIKTN